MPANGRRDLIRRLKFKDKVKLAFPLFLTRLFRKLRYVSNIHVGSAPSLPSSRNVTSQVTPVVCIFIAAESTSDTADTSFWYWFLSGDKRDSIVAEGAHICTTETTATGPATQTPAIPTDTSTYP
jgi:hypothetical protein